MEYEDYDPLKGRWTPDKELSALFGEVADTVMAQEGKAYAEVLAATDKSKSRAGLERWTKVIVEGMAFEAAQKFSDHLAVVFNEQAVEPAKLREAYAEIRQISDSHFEGQLRAGEDISAEDRTFNSRVAMTRAVYSVLIDRLLARLP